MAIYHISSKKSSSEEAVEFFTELMEPVRETVKSRGYLCKIDNSWWKEGCTLDIFGGEGVFQVRLNEQDGTLDFLCNKYHLVDPKCIEKIIKNLNSHLDSQEVEAK